ncbi:MAG: hypothetical protein ACREKB_03275 [Candidatus Rokuibacteriota bacterium]
MLTRRFWLPLAVLLAFAGCRDAAGPPDEQTLVGKVVRPPTSSAGPHILQQASTAPPLETYRISFWAYKGKASMVTVDYQPAAGQWVGQPFLRFDIPKNGLVAGADGVPLKRGDSVWVTLTIDSVSFSLHLQPSGVLFSTKSPANLTIWYDNADPDLNGDGVVNGNDKQLEQQLAFWYHAAKTQWSRLSSNNDTTQLFVSTLLYHFSEYAVSW